MQREMVPHRGSGLQDLYSSILKRARDVHRTDGDVLIWPASGSAGWEIAIVNLLSPGDPVLCTVVGYFGERFAQVAEAFRLDVRRLDLPWGQALTPETLQSSLEQNPDVKAVFLTHNETSTGVTNPLPELAKIVRDHGALVVVDAVSSAAGLPLLTDEWGLDFVLSGSQKAWMCPPGLIIVAAGPRVWDAYQQSTFPRFFWDLASARDFGRKGMTPTTPPLSLLYAFDAALDLILDEAGRTSGAATPNSATEPAVASKTWDSRSSVTKSTLRTPSRQLRSPMG
jgi:aspartate aminotransferase-like enzyme